MTTISYAVQGGSRILNATRVDQSGVDNGAVTNWVLANASILAVNINSGGKDTAAAQYKLRWRISGGSFADVASTGAIKFGATDLVNGAAIAVGGRKCDSQGGDTWQTGYEVEGTALSTSIDLVDEYETEIHFSLSCADAADGSLYEFELYDGTRGVTVGTCGVTLTTATAATVYYQAVAGVFAATGIVGKLVKTARAAGTFVATGIANGSKVVFQAVGGTFTATGTLTKKALKNVAGTFTATGSLAKKTAKTVAGNITYAGTLAKKVMTGKSGSLTLTGNLVFNIKKVLTATATFFGNLVAVHISGGSSYPVDVEINLSQLLIVDNRVSVLIDSITHKFNPFSEPGVSQMLIHNNGKIKIRVFK